jgi:diguanylate cyclase (GGDEF)-like protein
MAAFFASQLDFIFFFYGLAFILLGIVCFAIAKVPGNRNSWDTLGLFAVVHGLGEWLDLSALVVGDSPAFAIVRIALMTLSFIFLMEFARLNALRFYRHIPGRWVYLPLLALVMLGGWSHGLNEAGAISRYIFGFFGALGASIVFVGHGQRFSGASRNYAMFAAASFALYAVAAGTIVPMAPLWPATTVNHAWFSLVTGVPIQLIRGLLACAIASSVWALWGDLLVTEVNAESYTSYLRKQFILTAAAMATILVMGWALTEFLGSVYRQNVEQAALGDIDQLASRLAGETKIIDGMVMALARTQTMLPLVSGDHKEGVSAGKATLDLSVEASGASAGYVLDASGEIVAASEEVDARRAVSLHRRLKPSFDAAVAGKAGRYFAVDPDVSGRKYDASMPIRSDDGTIVGAAILSKSLDGFEEDLSHFGRPYFFVDPDGIVVLTNRKELLFRPLWPFAIDREHELTQKYKTFKELPLMRSELSAGEWTSFEGTRQYVSRRFVENSRWSLVVAMPTETFFASRLLGIIVTLLTTIMTLIYFAGREHGIRESVQAERRRKLHQLTLDLKYQATTDPLTGLFNRLKFDEALESEISRSVRYGTPFTLIIYDVDHFKDVNDMYGHQTGDEVLVRLSQVVAGCKRNSDLLARWGGEEFVILTPGLDSMKAYQAALKLQESIGQVTFGDVGKVTCSFGVAQYFSGETAEMLMTRADGAMYRAKLNGRDRVEVAPPPTGGSTMTAA